MQEKMLFPSLDRLSDYLVLKVRGASDAAPVELTISGAAKVWLRSVGEGYALYTHDNAGAEVPLTPGGSGGVTMAQVIEKIGELAAAKNHTHSVGELAADPVVVFPDEYYLIRQEWYALGCLRTDSYIESGDPENPMPELVSSFSNPRCLPYCVYYNPVKNTTGYPIEIIPGQMTVSPPIWNGDNMYISTVVRAGAGAIINTLHSSVFNYGVKMLTEKFPELYHDYGEASYVGRCYIKKIVGSDTFIIDVADRLKLLADDPANPVSGEVHLFPPELVTGYDMALAYWTAHYADLGNNCPAYKVVEV